MPLADIYRRKRTSAIWNGYQQLSRRNSQGWLIYGDLRTQCLNILRQLDMNQNSWFFALANQRPDPATAAGACMMLEHGVTTESMHAVRKKAALGYIKTQLLRNISEWKRYVPENGRLLFEDLRQRLTSDVPLQTVPAPQSLSRAQAFPPGNPLKPT